MTTSREDSDIALNNKRARLDAAERACSSCRYKLTFNCPCAAPRCGLRRLEFKGGAGCPQWKSRREVDG